MKFLFLNTSQSLETPHLAFSVNVAKRIGSSVTIFVVARDAMPPEESKKFVAGIEKRFSDVPHEVKFAVGDPLELIMKEIESGDYDINENETSTIYSATGSAVQVSFLDFDPLYFYSLLKL